MSGKRHLARGRNESSTPERGFLHVRFLRGNCVVNEHVLEERYASRAMAAWTARGREFKVRTQPAEFFAPRRQRLGIARRRRVPEAFPKTDLARRSLTY